MRCGPWLVINRGFVIMPLILALGLAGCGANNEERTPASGEQQSGDLVPKLGCERKQQDATALAESSPRLRFVPSDHLRFLNGDTSQTMCDLLRKHKKPLTLFHFVSVTCFSCMLWTREITEDLRAATDLSADVQSVVVLTDDLDGISEAQIKGLKAEIAAKAIWVLDAYDEMWGFFAPRDAELAEDAADEGAAALPLTTPMLVAVDRDSRGFYTANTKLGAKALIETANTLMELDLEWPNGAE